VLFAANPKLAQKAFSDGLHYEEISQWKPAEQAFSEAIANDPANAAYYLHRGKARFALADYQNSIEDGAAGLRLNRRTPLRTFCGRCLSKTGATAQALAEYDRAVELKLDTPAIYNSRAAAYASIGENNAAIADYTRGIKLRLDDPAPSRNGGTRMQTSAGIATPSRLRSVHQPETGLRDAYLDRGYAWGQLGIQASHQGHKFCNSGTAKDAQAYHCAAWLIYSKTRTTKRQRFTQALQYTRTIHLSIWRAPLLWCASADIRKRWRIARKRSVRSKSAEAYLARGGSNHQLGFHDKGLADRTKAIELNPNLRKPGSGVVALLLAGRFRQGSR